MKNNVFYLLLKIIADIKISLTPQSRRSIAISPLSFAVFSRVELLLLTSLHPPCKVIISGVLSVREGAT